MLGFSNIAAVRLSYRLNPQTAQGVFILFSFAAYSGKKVHFMPLK
jgi:hypothetical protein